MKKLFDYLIQYGGQIISSNELSPDMIAQARASDRMYVDDNGYGFIWEPHVTRLLPETVEDVELFEKWYPLKSEIPEHLKSPDWLFKRLNQLKSKP